MVTLLFRTSGLRCNPNELSLPSCFPDGVFQFRWDGTLLPQSALVNDAPVFANQVEPVGPTRIRQFHVVVDSVDQCGEANIEPGNTYVGMFFLLRDESLEDLGRASSPAGMCPYR